MNKLAIYLRLSQEDYIKKGESESIVNQRNLIKSYIQKDRDLQLLETVEYVDDGYTGTSENRPSYQRLLEDVKAGLISCIIVKDLSRFSRDYLEVGNYLENVFPFLNVRFISINDNYDSGYNKHNSLDMDMQFKSLLYDFYSKDLSQKLKTNNEANRSKGKMVIWYPSFGYKKDPNDRHKIVVDDVAAKVVKCIFQLVLDGYSLHKIAKILNEDKVLTPSERKKELTRLDYSAQFKKGNWKDKALWTAGALAKITSNEVYLGDYVYNKQTRICIGGRKVKYNPKSEWKTIPNTHEAIISREDWAEVQKIKATRTGIYRRSNGNKVDTILRGKVICKECGHIMEFAGQKVMEKVYRKFQCRICNYVGLTNRIKEEKIEKELEKALRNLSISSEDNIKETSSIDKLNKKLSSLKNKLKDKEFRLQNLYERYKSDILNKNEYLSKRKIITIEIDSTNSEVNQLSEEIESLNEKESKRIMAIDNISISTLTKDLVNRYVDKILIGADGDIEVILNDN